MYPCLVKGINDVVLVSGLMNVFICMGLKCVPFFFYSWFLLGHQSKLNFQLGMPRVCWNSGIISIFIIIAGHHLTYSTSIVLKTV